MPTLRSHVTMFLCTVLHAFTHAYGTLLVPLYLLMVADLRLNGVAQAAMLVTIYGTVYMLMSYAAGVLADRHDRKVLLGIGLIGNALAIAAMGFTKQYDVLVALAVVAGLCGTLFHPAANALVPAHYPKSPGMAIGLLGIGSGIGFWAGPQYAGWRAQAATWQLGNVSDWQRPCVELGLAGLVVGIIFLFVAKEAEGRGKRGWRMEGGGWEDGSSGSSPSSTLHPPSSLPIARAKPLGRALRWRCVGIAALLSLREFSGVAVISLASVYLQVALGRSPKETGFILGTIMLTAVVLNPLLVYWTRGRRRIPSCVAILVTGGVVVAFVPYTPPAYILPVLMLFYAFQLGSSAVNDAAMLERVAPEFRGRFVGLFLTIAGTGGGIGPWVMGAWTDSFRATATDPASYRLPFLVAGLCMVLAALAAPLIAALGKPVSGDAIDPLTETTPRTVGVVG